MLISKYRTRITGKDGSAQSKLEHHRVGYSPLSRALQYSWKDITSSQTKVLRPVTVFSILGVCVPQTLASQPLGSTRILTRLKQLAGNIKRSTAHPQLPNPRLQISKQ